MPEQRQRERRTRLIEAAVAEFGTEGYRATTINAVCARAGVGKRYFYESFDGSEALLLAAYEVVTGRIRDAIVRGAERGGTDPAARALGMLTGYFELIADDPPVPRIAFFEILGVSPAVDEIYRGRFQALVEVCVRALGLPPGPSGQRTVVTGLAGAMLVIAQQWVLNGYDRPLREVVDSAHLVVSAVLDRLDDTSPAGAGPVTSPNPPELER
ncbi:TetR/AcrR family transcriptional regulator [Nocardia stercoris]|uniref:TetR/AcrR family transcriptional regulator n=1 Tax=Nocardia stercoris TaxID=2483361 RepID=A0A3M2LCV9_9NOCA|nr:TetR/AcrR family transcriptional regulator [Nocardia stercoris]RMI34413.1 TetR/AcrR family transcriptional regulator [Nocardia stercoris]